MATTRKKPSTIAQAKKAKSKTFYGKGNKKLAAVTKEELEESGLSLRDYLNEQQGKTRRTAAKVAPRPKARPAPAPAPKASAPAPKAKASASTPKKYVGSDQRPDNRPVKSTPKSKPKTPKDILGTREQSRARRRARQEAKTKKDTSMTPEQKLKGQIGIGAAAAALIAPVALPILMKVATKHGPAFARSLGNKIKNLTSGQQKDVLKTANKGKTKTEAEKLAKDSMRVFKGGKSLKKDQVEPYTANASKPLTTGQSSASRTMDAAKQSQRKEIDPGYTGGALKRGGQIKKYNKGGKVVKRKEGGQVMSGNDLVSSLYN